MRVDKDVCDFTPDEIVELQNVSLQLLAIKDRWDKNEYLNLPEGTATPRVIDTAIALKTLVTGSDKGFCNFISLVKQAEQLI